MYSPSDKEFQSLQKANIEKRLKHFKYRVGGNCDFWLCSDDQGYLLYNYDKSGHECLCVWPAKEYASLIINKTDEKYLKNIEIHQFLHDCINDLTDNNINILVFPNQELSGALMTAESFKNMMEEELAKYGDYDDDEDYANAQLIYPSVPDKEVFQRLDKIEKLVKKDKENRNE